MQVWPEDTSVYAQVADVKCTMASVLSLSLVFIDGCVLDFSSSKLPHRHLSLLSVVHSTGNIIGGGAMVIQT